MLSYREYSNFNILLLTDNSEWDFFVDMDEIPCSIHILRNRLTKDRLEFKQTNNINTDNNINNIDIIDIDTPISRIVTMFSTIYTAVSSLLFDIEIIDNDYDYNYNYYHDYDHE
jgi:hypothetical protein